MGSDDVRPTDPTFQLAALIKREPHMNASIATERAVALLEIAGEMAQSERQDDRDKAQALSWVADSWTRLAESLDSHPHMA